MNEFIRSKTAIPPSGKIIGPLEKALMHEAVEEGHLTEGRFNDEFEAALAKFIGVKHARTCNSGSSANLLAFMALTSPKLGERRVRPGDEVITVAAGFPTTVNPILQAGCVPVFIDVTLPTYNIDVFKIERAITSKTKAIMLAHTLGNPFEVGVIASLAVKYNLWLIEDCCDALGATYLNRKVGTFGDIATLSFYPAHHITTGEGGAVLTDSPLLARIIESMRDWGRDCYCDPGCDNTCGLRFERKLGGLPQGYDHKYTYSHLGYNLKMTDLQAACGVAQMQSVEMFIAARRANFKYLHAELQGCKEFLILPEASEYSDPSWFGFPITLRSGNRNDLMNYLDAHNIGVRLLFSGNITRQPYFEGRSYRIDGELTNTDLIMNNTFWVGVWPGLSTDMLDFIVEKIEEFLAIHCSTVKRSMQNG